MGSLFGMIVALLFTAETLPYIVALVGIVVGFRLVIRYQENRVDVLAAERERVATEHARRAERERGLTARMWDQHRAYIRGDERGTYGIATPAMKQFRRVTK